MANDSEIPLLHEHNGITKEHGNSLEEERRLLYVAMTRARKKLFILYVTMDSNWYFIRLVFCKKFQHIYWRFSCIAAHMLAALKQLTGSTSRSSLAASAPRLPQFDKCSP
ncbi:hypothetical protein BVRB_7g161560 isoform C [Beta vulgaris subsp. vulgaris]|nr:hypothetical protein BVRB_7g161560 isoform C [Beta vulgaris subsp. vulgaris]